jgi:hypothetical protein
MTLRCECGGAVELTGQSYGEDVAFESYECASCGRTGSYTFGADGERMTGCLTDGGVA